MHGSEEVPSTQAYWRDSWSSWNKPWQQPISQQIEKPLSSISSGRAEVQTPLSLQCAGPLLCIPGTTARHQGTTKFCLCVPRSSETHTLYQFINCTGTFVAVFGFRQQIVSNTSYQCVDTNSWFQHVWNAPSGAVALRPRQGDCQELEEDCPRFWIEIVAGSQF